MLPQGGLLRTLRNMADRDNKLLSEALTALRRRLPAGWKVEIARPKVRASGVGDAFLRVVAPGRKATSLAVQTRRGLDPRAAFDLAAELRALDPGEKPLIVAPYLSATARERLQDAGINFLDLTGNVRLELRRPGLFIESQGASMDPDREKRPSRSLRGAKAGRIVRALVDSRSPPGVRALAARTGVDPGYVSRTLALLHRQALIERGPRGQIASVNWAKLLQRWAEDSPLDSRGVLTTALEPRGLAALQSRLRDFGTPYAITGSLAAAVLAPIAPPRLAAIYFEDPQRAMSELGLRPVDAGANVVLIEPRDVGVFSGAVEKEGLRYVAPSQAVADLLGSPGRGPAEAEELMRWMSENEAAWRG